MVPEATTASQLKSARGPVGIVIKHVFISKLSNAGQCIITSHVTLLLRICYAILERHSRPLTNYERVQNRALSLFKDYSVITGFDPVFPRAVFTSLDGRRMKELFFIKIVIAKHREHKFMLIISEFISIQT